MAAFSNLRSGRAAMYVRMSTEHQQYSTENQADAIEKYAVSQGLSIVNRFVDYGKSGLTLAAGWLCGNCLSLLSLGWQILRKYSFTM